MTEPHTAPPFGRGAEGREHEMAHVVPFGVLLVVFLALLLLTFATVAATWVHLGPWNLAVAMGIAAVKAALIALYFMHLRYDHPFHGFVFVVGLAFLALFLCVTLLDTFQYQPHITNW